MRTLLHITTRPDEPLLKTLAAQQSQWPDTTVTVVDLSQPAPDYDALVEQVFAADSVAVW